VLQVHTYKRNARFNIIMINSVRPLLIIIRADEIIQLLSSVIYMQLTTQSGFELGQLLQSCLSLWFTSVTFVFAVIFIKVCSAVTVFTPTEAL